MVPEIDVEELQRMLAGESPPLVLDVREDWEREVCALDGSLDVAMASVPGALEALRAAGRPVAVLCHHGVRSLHAAHWLSTQGLESVMNVRGGIDAWARRIDPQMEVY